MLFAMRDVHLVYIAMPPFLHYEQARAALRGGKHVIVEKPLAVTMEQADKIVAFARDTRRLLVTNLMQRYNPLFSQIKRRGEPLTPRPSECSVRVTRHTRPITASR